MKSKSKTAQKPAQHTIRLGEERRERIERFRAIKRVNGIKISTIDEAVNLLVDKALDLESITL